MSSLCGLSPPEPAVVGDSGVHLEGNDLNAYVCIIIFRKDFPLLRTAPLVRTFLLVKTAPLMTFLLVRTASLMRTFLLVRTAPLLKTIPLIRTFSLVWSFHLMRTSALEGLSFLATAFRSVGTYLLMRTSPFFQNKASFKYEFLRWSKFSRDEWNRVCLRIKLQSAVTLWVGALGKYVGVVKLDFFLVFTIDASNV